MFRYLELFNYYSFNLISVVRVFCLTTFILFTVFVCIANRSWEYSNLFVNNFPLSRYSFISFMLFDAGKVRLNERTMHIVDIWLQRTKALHFCCLVFVVFNRWIHCQIWYDACLNTQLQHIILFGILIENAYDDFAHSIYFIGDSFTRIMSLINLTRRHKIKKLLFNSDLT